MRDKINALINEGLERIFMPLPEKMSIYELEEEIKKQPNNEWLKQILAKKKRLVNRQVYEDILKKDTNHYT